MLQFLKWFAQSRVATKIYAQNGGLPPVASVLNGMAKSDPEYPAISRALQKYGFSEPRTPQEMQILQTLASDLSGAWAGVEPVNQALKNAQTAVKGMS
jgi:multiple sugar transport system substrate-binding protein